MAPVRLRLEREARLLAGNISPEREGKKEMSADPVSHAHAHTHIRKRRIRTLTSNIHRSRVTRSALPSSLLPEAGAWRNTLSSYMQGEIP